MSRARPKSQIFATLPWVKRTFLAARSLWMHWKTHIMRDSYHIRWICTDGVKFPFQILLLWVKQVWYIYTFFASFFTAVQTWASPSCASPRVASRNLLIRLWWLTYVFGGEELHAFGDLVGEAQQVFGVQRQAVLVKHLAFRACLHVGAVCEVRGGRSKVSWDDAPVRFFSWRKTNLQTGGPLPLCCERLFSEDEPKGRLPAAEGLMDM